MTKAEYIKGLALKHKDRLREYNKLYHATHKEQWSIYGKRWRRLNPEKAKDQVKRSVAKCSERYKAYQAKWQRDNPDKVRAKSRRYRMKHSRLCVERRKKWLKANPWRKRHYDLQRRAMANTPEADKPAVRAFLKIAERRRFLTCYYCEKLFPVSKITVEHIIPLTRGGMHISSNLAWSCKPCNSRKHNKTIAEWRN